MVAKLEKLQSGIILEHDERP